MKNEGVSKVEMVTCPNCGEVFNGKKSSGPVAKYCSTKCRARASYARNGQKHLDDSARAVREKWGLSPDGECANCGMVTERNEWGRPAKYCSSRCQKAYYRNRDKESGAYRRRQDEAPRCSVVGCEKPRIGRGLCGSHYSAVWRAENPSKHSAKNLRYRAQKRHDGAESFSRLEVLELSSWECHLCGDPIDPDCRYPNPLYGTVDHVVPLAKGGTHTLDNVKAAHHVCNSTKRDNEDYIHEVR